MAVYRLQKGSVFMASTAAGTTTVVTIGLAASVSLPDHSNAPVDITTLQSTMREFANTIADPGSASLNLIFDLGDNDHKLLQTRVQASTPEHYKIVFPTTTQQWPMYALVTGVSYGDVSVDDVVRATVNFKLTGSNSPTTA